MNKMSEKEYRAYPAISRSQLFHISESPEKFKYIMDNPAEPTESLIFGQLLHKMVLQPESFDEDFAISPIVDRRTKAGKQAWADFCAENDGKTVVTAEMNEKAMKMSEKLSSHPYVTKLLSGEREKPFFWKDELTGEACKCRVDAITDLGDMPLIVDLKTAASADLNDFTKHAIKYGYHFQAAMYRDGVKAVTGQECGFVFIVIEKEPPYAINIVQADDAFIRYGYDVFREYIGIYHDCNITGNWYGYLGKFNEINVLGLPSYLAKEV